MVPRVAVDGRVDEDAGTVGEEFSFQMQDGRALGCAEEGGHPGVGRQGADALFASFDFEAVVAAQDVEEGAVFHVAGGEAG